ncbi:MAG: TolC family protein [candidate division KSB1 bacterium]|nr:TolC family protein [candidate division KSB1 bacterium]
MTCRLCIGILLIPLTALIPQTRLSDCLQSGLASHPSLALLREQVRLTKVEYKEAAADRLASLDLNASYRRQSDVPRLSFSSFSLPIGLSGLPPSVTLGTYDTYDFRATLAQPLFSGFRLTRRLEAAELNQQAKQAELVKAENELALQIVNAYAQVLKAEKMLSIARLTREYAAEHQRWVEQLLGQGLVKKEEQLKSRVRLSEAELKVVQAENGLRLARTALASLTNLALGDSLTPLPVCFDLPTNLDDCLNEALHNRPEVKQLQILQSIGQVGVRIASGAYWPTLAAYASYGYGKPGLDFIRREWMDYWLLGAGMEWNLWSWGKKNLQVQKAEIRRREVDEQLRLLREKIALEVTEAVLRLEEAHRTVELTRTLLQQAEESRRVAESGYRQGQVLHVEVLDALSQWERAQLLYAQAEIDAAAAGFRLLYALGRPLAAE